MGGTKSVFISFIVIMILVCLCFLGLSFIERLDAHSQREELAQKGYLEKDGMRFYPDDTVEIPVKEDGKVVWEKAELQQDSEENIYIVNPKNGKYKIYKHGTTAQPYTTIISTGKSCVPITSFMYSDNPMPWGEEGTLPKEAKISDK